MGPSRGEFHYFAAGEVKEGFAADNRFVKKVVLGAETA